MVDITSILKETRVFAPSASFSGRAHIRSMDDYKRLRDQAAHDPEEFWAGIARDLQWSKPWDRVLEWKPPFAKWFTGGRLNLSSNCLDRHVQAGKGSRRAIVWEGEPGEVRTLTYAELFREVCRFANALKGLGIKPGDRVMIYMPMIPEAAVAMLACARIGAVHSVIFGGFTAEAIKDRIEDCQACAVVTADGGYRRGQVVPLKKSVDDAVARTASVRSVIVFRRTGEPVSMTPGRDHWWHDVASSASDTCDAADLDSEHPLYILYTSGSTGKPKGILHTTGGYAVQTYITTKWIFDLRDDDVYWCTADIGWVTGHSYVVYGPLLNAATVLMYEGAPNWPQPDRFWSIIAKHKATILYTAPTAIRAFIKWGDEWPAKHDLSSLRLLGTVGEPINPEAWMWYHKVIGRERCPIVDTWWQTETGSILISPLPGVVATKPGSATLPFPGIDAEVVSKDGTPSSPNNGGSLVVRKPWPSMLRTIYGDPERFQKQYFTDFPGMYYTGDSARRDEDGYFWIMGRADDVIKVSGHRLGTAEIESALVAHPSVAEAAVVAKPDDIRGSAIVAFVTPKMKNPTDQLKKDLKDHVARMIGAIARPEDIRFTDTLPKTRSGKIMRRLLREIATSGSAKGDMTTLEDFSVLAKLKGDDE